MSYSTPVELCQKSNDIFGRGSPYFIRLIERYNAYHKLQGADALRFDELSDLWYGNGENVDPSRIRTLIGNCLGSAEDVSASQRLKEEGHLIHFLKYAKAQIIAQDPTEESQHLEEIIDHVAEILKNRSIKAYVNHMQSLDRGIMAKVKVKERLLLPIQNTLKAIPHLDHEPVYLHDHIDKGGEANIEEEMTFAEAVEQVPTLEPAKVFALAHGLIELLIVHGKITEAQDIATYFDGLFGVLSDARAREYQRMVQERNHENKKLDHKIDLPAFAKGPNFESDGKYQVINGSPEAPEAVTERPTKVQREVDSLIGNPYHQDRANELMALINQHLSPKALHNEIQELFSGQKKAAKDHQNAS